MQILCSLKLHISKDYKTHYVKIVNSVRIPEAISQSFKPSPVFRHMRMQIYKTFPRLTLSWRSESWTIRRNDKRRLKSREMQYSPSDCMRNEKIMAQLQIP
jgi:hypothetical protein